MSIDKFGIPRSAIDTVSNHTVSELSKVARSVAPLAESMRNLHDRSGMVGMIKDLEQHHELMRAAMGPIDDWKPWGALQLSSADQAAIATVGRMVEQYQAQYRLPASAELKAISEQAAQFAPSTLFNRNSVLMATAEAMQLMKSPWLREHEAMLSSVRGFAQLQNIGHALKQMPAFGDDLTSALRADLGDWRDTITWPDPIFSDMAARSTYYVERGFNPDLTNFPADAFRESVDIAELGSKPASLVDVYGDPVPASNDPAEEEGLHRTNEAHDWLQRFEVRLRRFINDGMTAKFGSDWPRHRLPNGFYDRWQEKKQAALRAGERDRPLLDYADFTDYAPIMCRTDNWKQVFAAVYGRQESVRESLQRLYPLRICTMHARPITQDDQLFLYVEVKRLIGAID